MLSLSKLARAKQSFPALSGFSTELWGEGGTQTMPVAHCPLRFPSQATHSLPKGGCYKLLASRTAKTTGYPRAIYYSFLSMKLRGARELFPFKSGIIQ